MHHVAETQVVRDVLGSVRAEGLEPSPEVVALLEAHARGELDGEALEGAQRRLAGGDRLASPIPARG
jgi:Antitoxin VbhA